MKVGVDGVLVGCWADVEGANAILDVGTGCGVIALIMAQRQPSAEITAIEIDYPSAAEAAGNFKNSPWLERLNLIHGGFPEGLVNNEDGGDSKCKFDLIISNPPFFNSGINQVQTPRERARHQGELAPSSLLKESVPLLNPEGSLAMVIPSEFSFQLEALAHSLGYILTRKCLVRGHIDAPLKRVLLQWRFGQKYDDKKCREEMLTLEVSPGNPTDEYRRLCREFYLKF
ncbi:MAG: methyltransferase [Muribaculaceae bacterium]|nr:methyltransferase [Muribaculaceae bacterium]